MRRTLLILDGMNELEGALADAQHLCDPGDKLTVLAVAEKPDAALFGIKQSPMPAEPYTGGPVGGIQPAGGADVPNLESEHETEARVAGDLREELDKKISDIETDNIDIWTQAIVRDEPAEAVAEYIRSSDVAQIAVPRKSLSRLRELLNDGDEGDALDGHLAPVIVLPA